MIAVDIGNTYLHFFGFRKGKVSKTLQIPTAGLTKNSVKRVLAQFPPEPLIACSVVPQVNKLFHGLKQKVYFIGADLKVPIACQYNQKQVGMDRLVAAFSARKLFPESRLVIDFGTAITFDFLSKSGTYEGGIILPGIGSTLAVFSKCALLPKSVPLKRSRRIIPRNTQQSINKGLVEGFSEMLNALVKKYTRLLKITAKPAVVITGGEVSAIKSALNFRHHYEPYLVAKGLYLLAAKK